MMKTLIILIFDQINKFFNYSIFIKKNQSLRLIQKKKTNLVTFLTPPFDLKY